MGAHAVPKEYDNNVDSYVNLICDSMIPQVAEQGIAIFNDVFCEKGYFNLKQSERILKKGDKTLKITEKETKAINRIIRKLDNFPKKLVIFSSLFINKLIIKRF